MKCKQEQTVKTLKRNKEKNSPRLELSMLKLNSLHKSELSSQLSVAIPLSL